MSLVAEVYFQKWTHRRNNIQFERMNEKCRRNHSAYDSISLISQRIVIPAPLLEMIWAISETTSLKPLFISYKSVEQNRLLEDFKKAPNYVIDLIQMFESATIVVGRYEMAIADIMWTPKRVYIKLWQS